MCRHSNVCVCVCAGVCVCVCVYVRASVRVSLCTKRLLCMYVMMSAMAHVG